MAHHTDDLAHEQWLAVAHMDARSGQGKIFLATPLNPKDLASLVKEHETITWDTRKGGVIATRDLRIGSIVLQSKPIEKPDEENLIIAICNAIKKDGENLLDLNEDFFQWQNRVCSLNNWLPEEKWPDVSTANLLQTCHIWLAPYLNQIKRSDDLKKINLTEILQYSLSPEMQNAMNRLAPQRIAVPSGSSIKLQYQTSGSAPVLAVRLQEMFGLADTPSVNDGKNTVLLHLLSPGYKPVQVTSDLRSFWNNTYFEVRKELKNRYPKHVWPDDPWNEKAIKGVKKR
jgi:ATP-dependent helicase HrpB